MTHINNILLLIHCIAHVGARIMKPTEPGAAVIGLNIIVLTLNHDYEFNTK